MGVATSYRNLAPGEDVPDYLVDQVTQLEVAYTDIQRPGKIIGRALVECWGRAKVYVSTALDFTPVVGDVKGLIEAVYGRDLITGERLDWHVRLLSLLCLSELKVAGSAIRIPKRIKRWTKAVRVLRGKPPKRLVGNVYEGVVKSYAGTRTAQRKVKRLQRLLAENLRGGKAYQRELAEHLRKLGIRFDSEVYRKAMDGKAVFLDFLLFIRPHGVVLECKRTLWTSPTYKQLYNVRSMLNKIGRQVNRHKTALRGSEAYYVVFKSAPRSPVVKREVLRWAREWDIRVRWGLPRHFR